MRKISFFNQVIIASVLAIIVGITIGDQAEIFRPLGTLFIRLINFIIVPIILSTLIVGMSSTTDIKSLGRIGSRTIVYFLVTTFFAVIIGLTVGAVMQPGINSGLAIPTEAPAVNETEGFIATIINIVPANPIKAMADGNILQVIFFAIFIGLGITLVGEKATLVKNFFEGFAEIMYKITGIVMKFAPIGIFGLLAPIVGIQGPAILTSLFKLLLAVAIACVIHVIIVYGISVKYLGKVNFITFLKAVSGPIILAFSTQSSAGTLPLTMKTAEEKLNVSKGVGGFVLPLGATINMDGQAIYIGIAALFTAQFFDIQLQFTDLLMLALVATIGSIGTAGVPGAGLIMLSVALASVNLPLEAIALVAGIDRFLNMFSTATNVMGDLTAAIYVENKEKLKASTSDGVSYTPVLNGHESLQVIEKVKV